MPFQIGTLLQLLLSAALIAIALHRRLFRRMKPQKKRRRFRRYGSTLVALGFLGLQIVFDPKIGHAIEERLAEPAEDEDSGDLDGAVAHLHRQAKQIRRGIPPERITTYLPPRP